MRLGYRKMQSIARAPDEHKTPNCFSYKASAACVFLIFLPWKLEITLNMQHKWVSIRCLAYSFFVFKFILSKKIKYGNWRKGRTNVELNDEPNLVAMALLQRGRGRSWLRENLRTTRDQLNWIWIEFGLLSL